MSSKPCKEIVLRKNDVPDSDAHYDVLVFGDVVGSVFRHAVKLESPSRLKVTWLLDLKDNDRKKEFSSVKHVRSHMLHCMMNGGWNTQA